MSLVVTVDCSKEPSVILFASSLEIFPPLNDLFQIAPLPETQNDLSGDDNWALSISEAGGLVQFVRELGFPKAMSIFMAAENALTLALIHIFELTRPY